MQAMNGSLGVVDTITTAVNQLWAERKTLARLLILAGFVNGLLDWGLATLVESHGWGWYYVLAVLHTLVYTVLAVRVHRLVLGVPNPIQGIVRWSGRETKFLGWLVVVYFYFFLIMVAFGVVASVVAGIVGVLPSANDSWGMALGVVLVSLPAAYLLARLSVLLPAIAIDQKRNLAWAWSLTEGNGWRLVLILWVLPMLVSALLPEVEMSGLIESTAWSLFLGVSTAIQIALLSVAFKGVGGFTELQEAVPSAE